MRPAAQTTVFYRQSLWDHYPAAGGRAASPWPRAAAHRSPGAPCAGRR